MDWYYVEDGERRGPVAEAEIRMLVTNGKVNGETLIWHEPMKEWQRARSTDLFAVPPPPLSLGTAVCVVTGKTFPTSHMVKTEHGWVSAEARDSYYQALREGVPLPLAPGVANVFADKKYVVVPVSNAQLPRRCIKTNEPVTDAEVKRRKLYWCTPWVVVALLLNILIVLILYFILRKKIELDIPLSNAGRRGLIKSRALAWVLFVFGVALVLVPIFNQNLLWLIVLGLMVLIMAAIAAIAKGSLLRVAKMRDGKAWLSGACPEFVASLPQYVG